MAAKPAVDGLEQHWTSGQVIRVDILTSIGRAFADKHQFIGTPTFVLFDSTGNEVKRWQQPPKIDELP